MLTPIDKTEFMLLRSPPLLLAVITPVMGHGFKVTLSDYTELADLPEFDSVSTATKLYYLSESESRLEEYFLDKLNKNGIENVRVDITTDLSCFFKVPSGVAISVIEVITPIMQAINIIALTVFILSSYVHGCHYYN